MVRPRSNALTGPSDPRYLTANRQLEMELSRPLAMGDSLRVFIRSVYDNKKLMSEPPNLADRIYDLYSSSPIGAHEPERNVMRDFVQKLIAVTSAMPFREPPFLQNENMTLAELATLGGEPMRARDFAQACTDFIYFRVAPGSAAVRVYLNVRFDSVSAVVKDLLTYIKGHHDHGVVDFKVVGPAAIASRKDSIVVYCSSKPAADRIAKQLGKLSNQLYFNVGVPGMTTEVATGVGVGAEPTWQGTGMGGPKLKDEHKNVRHDATSYNAQSFGTIRSELIAMAIINFNANKAVVGNSFDVFAKFVAIAFRGYGLNPERPGD